MVSKCCNAYLISVLISSPPGKTDTPVGFTWKGATTIAQYCSVCGELAYPDNKPDYVPRTYKEAIR